MAIWRLIKLGESVAICEQVGDVATPRGRSAQGGARGHPGHAHRQRAAGDDKSESLLLAVHAGARRAGLAWLAVTQAGALAECALDELPAGWNASPPASCWRKAPPPEQRWPTRAPLTTAGLQFDAALGRASCWSSWAPPAWPPGRRRPQARRGAAALLTYAEHTQGRALTHAGAGAVQRAGEQIDCPPARAATWSWCRPCAAKTRPPCSRCWTPA
jgi:DNA mismatch repair protein MutS